MLNEKPFIKISVITLAAAVILIYAFSKSINYSIIFTQGFFIGDEGYVILIRTVYICLKKILFYFGFIYTGVFGKKHGQNRITKMIIFYILHII